MVRKRGGRGRASSFRGRGRGRGKSAISQDLKADESHETDEKKNKRCINVLVVGHTGAGKSLALHKINNLENDRVALEKATQNLAEVTMDESTSGQLLEHAMDKNEGELEDPFGEIKYESERSVFHFLEAPSDFRYAFKLMNKATAADIAILFISLGEDENKIDEVEKLEQTQMFIFLISTLSIKKLLIAINKIDSPNESQQSYHETIDSLTSGLVRFGFTVGTDIKCLPLSLKNNFNFQNTIGETWWNGPCFTQIIDEFEVSAHTSNSKTLTKWAYHLSQSMVDLVNTDLEIDEKPFVGALWFKRASTLIELKKYVAAFEAAAKAAELGLFKDPHKLKTVASMMTAGHYYRIKKNFPAATECFILLRDFYAKEKKTNVQQIIQDFLEQAWKEWEDPEKSKGKRSVVLSREEDDENDDNEKDETSSPGTQAQEEELSFNNSSPGTQAQEELSSDIQINQKIKVSSVSNYEINRVDDNFGMYEGMKIVSTEVCLPFSFIPGSPSQLKNFEQLVSLGLDNASILSIRDEVQIIEDGLSVTLLVVERVKTIEDFFSLELTKFDNEINRSDNVIGMWWNIIEVKFKRIYRDVVDTLVYLHSKNYGCGNLFGVKHNAIYITSEEVVRLLPSLDKDVTFASDVQELGKHMRGVINLPCVEHSLARSNLNDNLSHFFTYLDHRKLKHVPSWWLLDHPVFWTTQERVNFINNLIRLTKVKWIAQFPRTLADVMRKDDGLYFWPKHIPPGIFEEIWKKGDPKRQPIESTVDGKDLKDHGWIQVAPYKTNSDILRYMMAVYHHYNDAAYASYRSENLDDVAIEVQLMKFFPKIYIQLVDTIYECVERGCLTHEDLKMLSRHSWK